ncbi:putative membrane protein [Clostridioides difficile CD160]|nr:putative membrane protein [Clostridioides difficile CD160]
MSLYYNKLNVVFFMDIVGYYNMVIGDSFLLLDKEWKTY